LKKKRLEFYPSILFTPTRTPSAFVMGKKRRSQFGLRSVSEEDDAEKFKKLW
jgi:hypothetical protein